MHYVCSQSNWSKLPIRILTDTSKIKNYPIRGNLQLNNGLSSICTNSFLYIMIKKFLYNNGNCYEIGILFLLELF